MPVDPLGNGPVVPPQTPQKSNDDVLFVGMSKTGAYEASMLRARGVNLNEIKDSFEDDKLSAQEAGGQPRAFDLSSADGRRDFALSLGLPGPQTERIAEAIAFAGRDAKDELAQIARVWARAERGESVPSRLVLSGHNVGDGVWGDENGELSFRALGKLAAAMPKAAECVEDLHLAACYSGGQSSMEEYRSIFPRVKTIWAYAGSAPAYDLGATVHQRLWDTATRGTKADLDRAIAEGTRKGENVAVWSLEHGYLDGKPPAPYARVREDFEAVRGQYQAYFTGEREVELQGGLRDYYARLQRVLQHPELPAAERPALQGQRDQTIRLIFYGNVAKHFASHHAQALRAGFEAVGMPAPDFASLERAAALEQISALEARLAQGGAPVQATQALALLRGGLEDLRPELIPSSWI